MGVRVKTQNRTAVGIILVVVVSLMILLLFGAFTINSLDQASDSFSSDAIAVVEIKGVILESNKIIKKLLKAEKRKAKAIIIRIDSPGGAVAPTQEIYQEILRIDKKIPVYASFGSIAASGGYYVGSACREIYANPGTITGSIGVIMKFINLSKLYELVKVKNVTIKAGKYKDIGSPARDMTVEEKSLLNKSMHIVHKQFMRDIMRRREKKLKKTIWELAQGQIYSGEEAYRLGLVDHLGSLWTLGRKIFKDLKLEGEFSLTFIKDEKKGSLRELLDGFDSLLTDLKMGAVKSIPMFLFE